MRLVLFLQTVWQPVRRNKARIWTLQGEEYVVTATRTELTAKEVPQSVEVITKEEIQNIGASNAREALRLAANVEVPEARTMDGFISIRGSGTNDVLVLEYLVKDHYHLLVVTTTF